MKTKHALTLIGLFILSIVITGILLTVKKSMLKTDLNSPSNSAQPFLCSKVLSASSSNPGGNSPGNLNYGISMWYGVGEVTPYSWLGPTGEELATLSDSNVFEQRYIGQSPKVFAIGASDDVGQQILTVTCDTGTINVYTAAMNNIDSNMRAYVASDGSSYHSRRDHTYTPWPLPPDMTALEALRPEHLIAASPTYQADCYNAEKQIAYSEWSCNGTTQRKRTKTITGKNYNPATNACDLPATITTEETPSCDFGSICSAGTCVSRDLGGTIAQNTTWILAGSPYTVTTDITISPNVTVTIEPGVELQFNTGKRLNVRGTLLAVGSNSLEGRITFKSSVSTNPSKTDWAGIFVQNLQGGKATFDNIKLMNSASGINVECCGSGSAPISINAAHFFDNGTALSGYSGVKYIVENSIFENNTNAVSNADKIIKNSTFRNNTYGLYQTERTDVENSTFDSNETAALGGRGFIKKSTFTNNNIAVAYFFEGFNLSYNTFSNNRKAIILGTYGTTANPFSYNNFIGNTLRTIEHTAAPAVEAQNNWWGTTESTVINEMIWDGKDSASLGLVNFSVIMSAPIDITGNQALPSTISLNTTPSSPSVNTSSELSGSIFKNITLTKANSPYIVTDSVTLFPGYTMTVEPGVTVKFNSGKSLNIRGNLVSDGSSAENIIFTTNVKPETKGSWGGINLATTLGAKASFKYTVVSFAQTAVNVDCCHLGGPVTISNSIFRKNTTALGGYAGWDIVVDSSLFEENTYGATNADKVFIKSEFKNNTYGLYQVERVDVDSSTFTNNEVALFGGRGLVKNSLIADNLTGVKGFFEGFTLNGNTIRNNGVGLILSSYSNATADIQNNNIYNNTEYNVRHSAPNQINAKYIYWGGENTTDIAKKIFDGKDDQILGLILFEPFLIQPYQAPVVSPPPPPLPLPTPPVTGSGNTTGNVTPNFNSPVPVNSNNVPSGSGNQTISTTTNTAPVQTPLAPSFNSPYAPAPSIPSYPSSNQPPTASSSTPYNYSGSGNQASYYQPSTPPSTPPYNQPAPVPQTPYLLPPLTNQAASPDVTYTEEDICGAACDDLSAAYGDEVLERIKQKGIQLEKSIDELVEKVTSKVMEEAVKFIDYRITQVMMAHFDKLGAAAEKLLESNTKILAQLEKLNLATDRLQKSALFNEVETLKASFEQGVAVDPAMATEIETAWNNLTTIIEDPLSSDAAISAQLETLKILKDQADLSKLEKGFAYRDVPYIFDPEYDPQTNPEQFWYNEAVINLTQLGLVSGYQQNGQKTYQFGPANPLLRAEVLKVALLLYGYDVNVSEDVSWQIPYVDKGLSLGLSIVKEDALAPVTRGEMFNLLYELGLRKDVLANVTTYQPYLEVTTEDPYWKAFQSLYELQIVRGQGGKTADLYSNINRAEMAKLIDAMQKWLDSEKAPL